jgi:hypothetical protein
MPVSLEREHELFRGNEKLIWGILREIEFFRSVTSGRDPDISCLQSYGADVYDMHINRYHLSSSDFSPIIITFSWGKNGRWSEKVTGHRKSRS